jgi:hypothetical protein
VGGLTSKSAPSWASHNAVATKLPVARVRVYALAHTNFLTYLKVCGCQTLCVQHTAYVQNRAHHTDRDCASGQKIPVPTSELSLPCPREHLASASSASATERTQAPPTPQRVITSPAQRSTTEGAPWPIPRNCPPSPPPWPLISQPRPRSPSSTTTEHSTPTKARSLRPCPPPSLRTRADAYMCAFAGACMCMRVEPAQEHARPCDVTMGSFSFEAPHLVVPLTWQASRPP